MSADRFAEENVLLRVEDLVVEYPRLHAAKVPAVSGVSFELRRGEALGIVGESGCGKSSLARAIMQLPPPNAGTVLLDGEELTRLPAGAVRPLRRQFQMVFQDPVSSLNPSRSVGKSIEEPLRALERLDARERQRRAWELMEAVGLAPERHYDRLPRQLSGGQCQRVSIARALVTRPKLLVCDEPVSSLDVSVQAQILNLLREIRSAFGLSILFIAHDLAVVRQVCDRVAVMYLGRLCEVAPVDSLFELPAHPYTQALLAAASRPDPGYPLPDPGLLTGEPPSTTDPPSGCRFRTRCPAADAVCAAEQPELRDVAPGHQVACHHTCLSTGIRLKEEPWKRTGRA